MNDNVRSLHEYRLLKDRRCDRCGSTHEVLPEDGMLSEMEDAWHDPDGSRWLCYGRHSTFPDDAPDGAA